MGNTFWLRQGGKVYRSVNWVYHYYISFDHSVNLDDKIPYYFEQIRRRSFKQGNINTRTKKGCGSGCKRSQADNKGHPQTQDFLYQKQYIMKEGKTF